MSGFTTDDIKNIINDVLKKEKQKLISLIEDHNKVSMNNSISYSDLKKIIKAW